MMDDVLFVLSAVLAAFLFILLFLGLIIWQIRSLKGVTRKMATDQDQALADLQAQVAQNSSVEQSALTLIQGLAAQAANIDDATQLEAFKSSLQTSAAALAAAITANTPAAPPAPAPAS